MKVLVTGGCGLIGSHVAEFYHRNGDQVVIIDNNERSSLLGHTVSDERMFYNNDRLEKLGIKILDLDVSKKTTWDGTYENGVRYDAIIHCAAQCGVPTSIANPIRDFEVNALGTLYMLEAARRWDSKVVYASTNKVYPIHSGWKKEGLRWRWDHENLHKNGWPVEGMNFNYCSGTRTPYGASKYLGDLYCQEYAGIYGVKTGVFRMSCILGIHQLAFSEQGWATWFAIALEKELPVTIYGDGHQVRDMLYVSDVVRAYDAYIRSDIDHGVWNLGGGPKNTLSINECVNELLKLAKRTSMKRTFGHINYQDWRPSDQRIYTSDIRPIKEDLGWEPTINPIDGLKEIYSWVRKVSHVF